MKPPRVNKTKAEIAKTQEQVLAANRMRDVLRKKVYPFLRHDLNDTVGYTKVFLQSCASAVDSAANEKLRASKVADYLPRLTEIFTSKDKKQVEEYAKYLKLFELLKDETIGDFATMIQTLPRAIEQYFTHEQDKHSVVEVDIEKILGK